MITRSQPAVAFAGRHARNYLPQGALYVLSQAQQQPHLALVSQLRGLATPEFSAA